MEKVENKNFTRKDIFVIGLVCALVSIIIIISVILVINNNNKSIYSDKVDLLNEVLIKEEESGKKNSTYTDVLNVLKQNNYTTNDILTTNDELILYSEETNRFVLEKDGKIIKGDKASKKTLKHHLWMLCDNTNDEDFNNYSVYLLGNKTIETLTVSKGFDCGENVINTLNYQNSNEKQEVVIRTNNGALNIEAKEDTVKHYNNLYNLEIKSIDKYYEYGKVFGVMNAQSGKVFLEEGSVVYNLYALGDVVINQLDSATLKRLAYKDYLNAENKVNPITTLKTSDKLYLCLGEGSKDSPYVLETSYHINELSLLLSSDETYDAYASKYYILNNDIDLSELKEFNPIGSQKMPFKGYFDGNNKTIKGLISNNLDICAGLFGRVYNESKKVNIFDDYDKLTENDFNCVIKDLTLENFKISVKELCAGALSGSINNAWIENITIKQSEVKANSNIGMISGDAIGSVIKNITITNDNNLIGAEGNYGGVVGVVNFSNNSSNSGMLFEGINSSCIITGNTKTSNNNIGGITGLANEKTIFKNCTFDGSINANETNKINNIGGIVGFSGKIQVLNCNVSADIKGYGGCVSGITGVVSTGIIKDTLVSSNISGKADYMAGIIGFHNNHNGIEMIIDNTKFTGTLNNNLSTGLKSNLVCSSFNILYKNMEFDNTEMLQANLPENVIMGSKIKLENVIVKDSSGSLDVSKYNNLVSDTKVYSSVDLSNVKDYTSINGNNLDMTLDTINNSIDLTVNATNSTITVPKGKQLNSLTINGDNITFNIEGEIKGIITFGDNGKNITVNILENAICEGIFFTGNGTFTLNNYGTIRGVKSNLVSTESDCEVIINNFGTIEKKQSEGYLFLFYHHKKVTINLKEGSVIKGYNYGDNMLVTSDYVDLKYDESSNQIIVSDKIIINIENGSKAYMNEEEISILDMKIITRDANLFK